MSKAGGAFTFLGLFFLWIIMNGRITLEICLFGLGLSLAICLFCAKTMGYSFRRALKLFCMLPRMADYGATLVWEMVKSAIYVSKVILSPKRKPDPALCEFSPGFENKRSEVVLANSITLTPGTITVRLAHGELGVHCLCSELQTDLQDGVFARKLRRMEAKK